jgi:hypothetical protein
MQSCTTLVHQFFAASPYSKRFKSGISLHSHTMHSKEYLGRLPAYIAKFPIGSYILEREIGRAHLHQGRIFDFNKYYWTPPLSPHEAYRLESEQIEKMKLAPLVSLTDHDNIEAGMHLRMLTETARTPVSVEWTVPYRDTEFHLGIHNLPPSRANGWMKEFTKYTAKPNAEQFVDVLARLNGLPNVLIVLNHPYWDAESIGPAYHRKTLHDFLASSLPFLHAIELNGMRSRRENREVLQLAEDLDVPVISGGDRHGCAANSVLNVSRAETFDDFVHEVRYEKHSEMMLMPQFFEPLPVRLIENAWHALSDAPGEFGRRHWMTRVFIEENGKAKALSQFTGTRFQRVIDAFRWVIGLVANPVLRPALKLPFLGNEEGGL